ncbi:ribonuclease P protein component [Patescibacteria group bacterium]|nr:ribonuclease P protein component [Patescibacteria group bacterium]
MLSKRYRTPIKDFPSKAEILFRGKTLLAKKASNNLKINRVGVSVTTKKAKRATVRNAFKRFVMDFLGRDLDEGGVDKGIDLLIMPSAPIIKFGSEKKNETKEDLKKIRTALNKLK